MPRAGFTCSEQFSWLRVGANQEMLCICRNALQRPDDQIGYFGHFGYDRLDVLRFTIDVLGNLGVAGDLPFLRSLSDDQALGQSAIKAIQLIEGRINNVGN
ncbi:hypothetical protein CFBP498_49370 (plasmid) [Xanthomonas hortorum pv. vitians]|uniref:Uncharacterized protein n=3 Tax=Xanthomonas hortorum TaxID=56454 RepID=A0A6V7FJ30_9XANT|nr:hypothetical protein [Xanthomonas hortorum]CAD0363753.1 hypothetical protein CFBP498_49370 [Xanthomonas hortorum pv. vitians]CAD0363755.1 hypothetical protein CFBP498_49370 [Xanthomonas hortorum pv. vitians]